MRVQAVRVPGPVDAEAAFEALYRDSPAAFWLDSARGDDPQASWSFLGDASGPLAAVARADVWRGTVTVTDRRGTSELTTPFFDWFATQHVRDVALADVDVPFQVGWVGYLGYELKAECDGAAAHRSSEPDAALLFADRVLAVDARTGAGYLFALDEGTDAAQAWLSDTAARLARLEPAGVPVDSPGRGHGEAVTLRHGRAEYLKLVERCQDAIRAGDSYELCLTNLVEAAVELDPWHGYLALRRIAPAPFAALFRFGELSVLSSSPERFLTVSADGVAESRPIKGTRPRGGDPVEDARLAADLATNPKDRAENVMIVDLVRNDLARVAQPGSVEVAGLFDVESYATVHQLVSTVRARLREECSAVDCLRAAFPGGSMTGAPKLRTMEILDELEAGPRGIYSGALGWFGVDGALDLAMVIRTLVVTAGSVRYGVGGAIVADSDPVAEFDETVVKATPLLRLLGSTVPG